MDVHIFGSPVKLFQVSKQLYDNDIWAQQVKEWVSVLLKENERRKKEAHPEAGLALPEAASLAFVVSRRLNLPSSVKYLALDIYYRFCLLHIHSLTKIVREELSEGRNDITLSAVQDKVATQAPLRVLTCLRIASKLTCHKKVMTAECVQNLLKEAGCEYSIKSINKSELRILEQIKFRCCYASSPMEYIGVLVAYVGTVETSSTGPRGSVLLGDKVDDLHRTTLQLLDTTYLRHDSVYGDLIFKITGSRVLEKKCRLPFAQILSDRMLLSCSIVTAAGWILGGDGLGLSVARKVADISDVPEEDINILASCIVQNAVNKFDTA